MQRSCRFMAKKKLSKATAGAFIKAAKTARKKAGAKLLKIRKAR
jgi:hypothetical protein